MAERIFPFWKEELICETCGKLVPSEEGVFFNLIVRKDEDDKDGIGQILAFCRVCGQDPHFGLIPLP